MLTRTYKSGGIASMVVILVHLFSAIRTMLTDKLQTNGQSIDRPQKDYSFAKLITYIIKM